MRRNVPDDDEVEFDTSTQRMVFDFLAKNRVLVIFFAGFSICLALFTLYVVSPVMQYDAFGNIQSYGEGGYNVTVNKLSAKAPIGAFVENPVRAESGICEAPLFASRCTMGARVIVTRYENRYGHSWWRITALVISEFGDTVNAEEEEPDG